MRISLILGLFALTGCAQLASLRSPDPTVTKASVQNVVDAQRKNKEWMSIDSCPFERMSDKSRRPDFSKSDCAGNPEGCLKRCDAKDADACYFLANLIQEHDTIENDVAEVLYQRSCELGITSGCTNRASGIFEKNEVEGLKCAARTFEKTCSLEDPWGCTMYGLVLAEGIGREKNVPEALNTLRKACDVSIDKNGGACKRANELRVAIARLEKPNS